MKEITLTQIEKAVDGTLIAENPAHGALSVSGVSTDSRGALANHLFVPLKGERNDGHDYILSAFANGAVVCLSEKDIDTDKPVIKVKSTAQALKSLAMYYKSLLKVKTVAITGSVGKTTTKDMIASVLSQKFSVLKTEGNFNNEIGLPLTVFKLEEHHEYAVLEMGMSGFGEISQLSEIAKPDICVITNIGVSHIEKLGSREGILKAKSEIFEHMNETGRIILNGDDELLATLRSKYPGALYYGVNKSLYDNYKVVANDIVSDGMESVGCTFSYANECFKAVIPFPGNHMVQNALAAVSVGFLASLSPEEIKAGIEGFKLTKMRMDILTTDSGITVINDVYNASPDAMKAAVDILAQAKGRKVSILGDMLELGEYAPQLHEEVGKYTSQRNIDIMIFVGEQSLYAYHSTAKNAENTKKERLYFETKKLLLDELANILKAGDTVLVKASRGMAFEDIVNKIFEVKL